MTDHGTVTIWVAGVHRELARDNPTGQKLGRDSAMEGYNVGYLLGGRTSVNYLGIRGLMLRVSG